VSRQLEFRNNRRRTLNTRLSSGTSAGTFACPAGPYRNCRGEASRKNDQNLYFVPNEKKDPKIDPHVSNLKSREFLFWRVQVHPYASRRTRFAPVKSLDSSEFSSEFSDLKTL